MQKKTKHLSFVLFGLLSLLLLEGCAAKNTSPDLFSDDVYDEGVYDPLQPINSVVFRFNNKIYDFFLYPLTDVYEKVVPTPIRNGIVNIFHNLMMPVRVVGDLAQLKGEKMVIDFFSPLGNLPGLWVIDTYPSDDNLDDESLEQGVASWNLPLSDTYIVWPLLGPATLGSSIGKVGDFFLTPQTYLGCPLSPAVALEKKTNELSLENPYRDIVKSAVNPYGSVQQMYLDNFKQSLAE